jgi:hypothetical protein
MIKQSQASRSVYALGFGGMSEFQRHADAYIYTYTLQLPGRRAGHIGFPLMHVAADLYFILFAYIFLFSVIQ